MDDSCCCKSIGSEIECRRRSSSLEIRTPRRFETLSPLDRPGMKIPGTSSSRRRGKTTTFLGGSDPGPSEIVFRSALSSDSSGEEPLRDMSGNPGRKNEEVCPDPDFLLLLLPVLLSLELLPPLLELTAAATTTTGGGVSPP